MYKQDQINIIINGQKNNLTLQQIAEQLGKTPEATRVYMYRNGYSLKRKIKCPIVEKLINIKFADARWFKPNRDFYAKCKISQKRFSDLRHGYANPTEEEMKKIASALEVSTEDLLKLFDSRQLELFN